MTTKAVKLQMPHFLWWCLVSDLRRRGRGVRESGAFLLGVPGSISVSEYVCYDDLDPHCLDTGIIRFDGSGYVPLWKLCTEKGLKVLADVHTHPSGWTGQSGTDIANPMIAQAGHIAIIVPHYARRSRLGTKGANLYLYGGNGRWNTLPVSALKLTFF